MDCKQIKKIIPSYIKRLVSQEDVQRIEEHLCICQSCREYLSGYLDKKETVSSRKKTISFDFQEIINNKGEDLFSYAIIGLSCIIVIALLLLVFKSH